MNRKMPLTLLIALVGTANALAIQPEQDGSLRFTLVQPDIRQEEINDPLKFEEQFARIAQLSMRKEAGWRMVLWPESGVPD